MSNTAFLDDVTPEVRDEARSVAEKVAPNHRDELFAELQANPELLNLVTALAYRLVSDLASGLNPRYTTAESEMTPNEAARYLGVSRQFLDRQLRAGRITYRCKPGSTHRLVSVVEVERFATERDRKRTATDKAIEALLDAGAEL